MGVSFGDNPRVTTEITLKHNRNVLDQDEKERVTWFNSLATTADKPRVRVEDTSRQTGYQYHQFHQS